MRSVAAVVPLMLGLTIGTLNTHHPAASRVPVSSPPPAATRTLNVTANDYAFVGMPQRVSAGWVKIRMINAGKEMHMFATASVPPGMTPAATLDSIMKLRVPKGFTEWGGPNAVEPGDTTTVTVFVPAGSYVVGCFVVSPDGKTHFMKGMMSSFEAVASGNAGAAPVSDRSVLLSSYRIDVNGGPLTKGSHVLMVRNTAPQPHDFVILKLLPGHTVTQALAWFRNPPVGTPAAVPVAGTTGLHLNETGYVNVRFTPGTYILVCWLKTDNKPHIQLGMDKVITIS